MAGVATGAIGSLLLKLGSLLKEEYKLHKGVKEDVKYLERELQSMHAALGKVGDVPRDQLDEQVKLWADDIRDQSYTMEDIVDKFVVRVKGPESTLKPPKLTWLKNKVGELFTKVKTRHEIGRAIKGIKARVQEVADRRDRYKVNEVFADRPSKTTVDPRLLAMYKDRKDLVGIDGALSKLTEILTCGNGDGVSKELNILSIFGLGGLGKTTLAKVVYDKLQRHFEWSAFVSVGRNPNVKKLLNDILFELDKQKHRDSYSSTWDERQLIDQLRGVLENKRYFIVIDDIWDTETWEILKCAFIDSNCESRIMTTTRILEVARQIGEVYRLEPLSRDLSEQLFYTRLFGGKMNCPCDQLSNVDKMLHKCGGVPLAIITMASLLLGKPIEDWPKVYNSIRFGYKDNKEVENTRKILLLSYYDLPSPLRSCLLYLSIYPEDHLIDKDTLIWKWVGEGFVHEEPGAGLYNMGEVYFNELIDKSMIQPVETPYHGIIIGCRVHDMVLDMIHLLAKEENFVTVMYGNEQQTHTLHSNVRRLAMGEQKYLTNTCITQLRSFNALDIDVFLPSLSSFQCLRVLALEGDTSCMRNINLKHLGKLVHLRYLRLGMMIDNLELPKELGNLKFLQTLDLAGEVVQGLPLPPTAAQLSQLKCLRAYSAEMTRTSMIEKLTSLEELWIHGIYVSHWDVQRLSKLTQLRKLHIKYLRLVHEGSMEAWADTLVKWEKIEVIDICWVITTEDDDATRYWEGYIPPRQLRVLHMSYRQPSLLAKISPSLLPNLSHLSVHVETPDHLVIFGRFSKLVTLKMDMKKLESIQHHGVMGAPGAFPKLRVFKTDATPRQFLEGDMPNLESLEFCIDAQASKDDKVDDFDYGSLVNLPLLKIVTINIWGWNDTGVHGVDLTKAEEVVRHAIDSLPNRPILHVETHQARLPAPESPSLPDVQMRRIGLQRIRQVASMFADPSSQSRLMVGDNAAVPSSPPPPPLAHDDKDGNLVVSPPPSAVQLPSAFRPYDSSSSSAMDIDIAGFAFSAGPSFSDHESVLRKRRHRAKRSTYKNMNLRPSSRLAVKEPRNFTDMTTKAVRVRAARLSANDVEKALKDAIPCTQLDIPEALPASAAALAEISELCCAAAAAVAHADDNTDVGGGDVHP